MTRTAMAGTLTVVLVTMSLLLPAAVFPTRTSAQELQGVGTPRPAQTQAPEPKPRAKPSAPPAPSVSKATLQQFAWLTGRWQGDWGPRVAQQVWMPPQSGVMVGVFQLTEDGKTLVVELYTIVAAPHGIELRVRHFTPTLTAWETNAPSVLKLTSIDSKSMLFKNEDNGQPKHWLMKRTEPDTYIARFEIVPEKGEAQSAQITYHLQDSSIRPNHQSAK